MIQKNDIEKTILRRNQKVKFLFAGFFLLTLIIYPINPLYGLIYLFIFLLVLFFLGPLIHIRSKKFNCIKCGICCKLQLIPSENDIKRIEKTGIKREYFLEGRYLKKVNGYCMFLENRNGEKLCSIHSNKPKLCNEWPFHDRLIHWKWYIFCPSLRKLFRKN